MIKKLEEEGIEEELKELILTKMVCFGPTASCGTNFLISQFVKPGQSFLEKACLGKLETEDFDWVLDENVSNFLEEFKTSKNEMITAVKHGFWSACQSGPLAQEQMMGVVFIIEKIETVEPIKDEKPEEIKK